MPVSSNVSHHIFKSVQLVVLKKLPASGKIGSLREEFMEQPSRLSFAIFQNWADGNKSQLSVGASHGSAAQRSQLWQTLRRSAVQWSATEQYPGSQGVQN